MSQPESGIDRLDPVMRRLLASRPPDRALRWVERAVGGTVEAVTALTGGMSSAVHLLTVRSARGAGTRVVLRRYVRADVTLEEPDIAEREVRTLELVEPLDLVTPTVVASDATGVEVGVPTILMTVVPGAANAVKHGPGAWRQLAEAAHIVHEAGIGLDDGVQRFYGYDPRRVAAPPWMAEPNLWDRALAVFHADTPPPDQAFLHRDFHTGNVLWEAGRLGGVVDWQAASIGPPSIDIAYMRFDVLDRYGPDAAETFLRLCGDVTGLEHHPWADVILLVDSLGVESDEPPDHHRTLEGILGRALAELGAP